MLPGRAARRRRSHRTSSSAPPTCRAPTRTVDVDVSGSVTQPQRPARTSPSPSTRCPRRRPRWPRPQVDPGHRHRQPADRRLPGDRPVRRRRPSRSSWCRRRQQLVGPQLIAGAGPIRLDAGQSVEVAIADFVTVGGGGEPPSRRLPPLRATQGTAIRTSATTLTLSARRRRPAARPPSTCRSMTAPASVTVLACPWRSYRGWCRRRGWTPPSWQVEAGTSGTVDLAALTTTADEQQAVLPALRDRPGAGRPRRPTIQNGRRHGRGASRRAARDLGGRPDRGRRRRRPGRQGHADRDGDRVPPAAPDRAGPADQPGPGRRRGVGRPAHRAAPTPSGSA